MDMNEPAGPYASAAHHYWAAGWRGILPLPARKKHNPPTGYTGETGAWPSYADLFAWADGPEGAGNIGLRLPPHVIGLDVDHYADKHGADILDQAKTDDRGLGPLPPTWRSTSRTDGRSGIRLYRVPEGLRWPGELGPNVDIIQARHRYVVAAPSIHPDGGTYAWIGPDGQPATIPAVDALPALPDRWVAALTHGELATDTARGSLGAAAGGEWLTERATDGGRCRATASAVQRATMDLRAGSRHAAALLATGRLVRLIAEGHTDGMAALAEVRAAFLAACADGMRGTIRGPGEADHEWTSLLVGAINLVSADPHDGAGQVGDPCDNEFHGIIARPRSHPGALAGAGLAIGGTHAPSPAAAGTVGSTGGEPDLSSWWPTDLGPFYDGDNPEPGPEFLHRTDGHALFYPGRVNGIIGESESGKSWIALAGVVQAITAGTAVTYVDFEDAAPGIVARLKAMGVDRDIVAKHLAYIAPDAAYDAIAHGRFHEHLAAHAPGMVIVDGVNAAMALLGFDLLSNLDATRFSQEFMKPIAARGPAVVYVDHIPKSKDNDTKGGIGAQAKRAMTTGATLKATLIEPFAIGASGRGRLHVDKDRPGHVRARGKPSAAGHWVADVTFTATDTGGLTVSLIAPLGTSGSTPAPPRSVRSGEVDTIRGRLIDYLAVCDDGATVNTIKRDVRGNASAILIALDGLVADGIVRWHERTVRGGTSKVHRLVRHPSNLDDLIDPT